jgi:hypothetical protein
MPAHQIRFLIPRRHRLVAITRNRIAAQVRAWGDVLDQETADTLDLLAQHLAEAAVRHLGAGLARLDAAVQALSDPNSTNPVGRILRGPAATSG